MLFPLQVSVITELPGQVHHWNQHGLILGVADSENSALKCPSSWWGFRQRDMYSNRHRLKASSPALDTFTRKNKYGRSAKAGVCVRQHKNGSCAADHTCIQIGIAWTPLQVLLTHTHARTKKQEQKKTSQSEKAGVCMRQKIKECARQIIQVFK